MTTGYFGILVAIETDATRYHGENPQIPTLLNRNDAEQVLSHLATDLQSIFPDFQRFTLTMPGALYDMSQLLRPAYPIYESLQGFARDASSKAMGSLLSIGAVDERMPVEPLQPEPDIPPGALQLLPLLIGGPGDDVQVLSDEMEHRFMEEGQVSAHSAKSLEASFNIRSSHARFMTMTDLQAMLKLQLEHFGFLALWELLDCAINEDPEAHEVQSTSGHRFNWTGQHVLACFETFDHWATRGAGSDCAEPLDQAYARWTREYRQYLVTLALHGITVLQAMPEGEEILSGSFFMEVVPATAQDDCATVTEHFDAELGTIAVTVLDDGEQINLYPLSPDGLNDLHTHIRDSGLASDMAFPGRVCFDPEARKLCAEVFESQA